MNKKAGPIHSRFASVAPFGFSVAKTGNGDAVGVPLSWIGKVACMMRSLLRAAQGNVRKCSKQNTCLIFLRSGKITIFEN
jgi:hypothetical protein